MAMLTVYGGAWGSSIQSLLALIVVLIFIVLHIRCRPYEFQILHDLEKWSLIVAFTTFYFGAYLVEDAVSVDIRLVISLMIVAANFLFFIYFIFVLRMHLKQKFEMVRAKLSRSKSKAKDRTWAGENPLVGVNIELRNNSKAGDV